MIDHEEVLRIKTKEGKDIEIVVNWNQTDEVSDCKMMKWRIDGREFHIKTEDLHSIMLILGTHKQTKDLLPVTITQVKRYETQLEFRWVCSRNFKKGEEIFIKAPHIVSIPVEEMAFAGALDKKIKNNKKIWMKPKT